MKIIKKIMHRMDSVKFKQMNIVIMQCFVPKWTGGEIFVSWCMHN